MLPSQCQTWRPPLLSTETCWEPQSARPRSPNLLPRSHKFLSFVPQDLPEHGVTTVFVELSNTKLELLHPLGEKSPIAGYLDKNKAGGIHHICIEVNDIQAAVADVKSKKIRCLSAEPRIGAHGKPVMFLHPKDCNGVLVELEQE